MQNQEWLNLSDYDTHLKSLQKTLEEFAEQNSKIRNSFNDFPVNQFSAMDGTLRQIESHMSPIQRQARELIRNSINLPQIQPNLSAQSIQSLKQAQENIIRISEQFKPYQSLLLKEMNFTAIQKTAYEMEKQLEPFRKQTEALFKALDFPKISTLAKPLASFVASIPVDTWTELRLNAQYWIIPDKSLIKEISVANFERDDEVTDFITNFYAGNEWNKVHDLLEKWGCYDFMEQRLLVLRSCLDLAIAGEEQGINSYLAITPAMIAQIDGLMKELSSALPSQLKKKVDTELRQELQILDVKEKKRKDLRDKITPLCVGELTNDFCAYLLEKIIIDGLFRNSNDIDNLLKENSGDFCLFRHKIMHGDSSFLNYGTKSNFIRLILYINFIVETIHQIKSKMDLGSSYT